MDLSLKQIKEYYHGHHDQELVTWMKEGHPAEVAELFNELKSDEVWDMLLMLSLERRVEIFSFLDLDVQVELAETLRRDELAAIFTELDPDERADLYNKLPEEKRQSILPALAQAEREDIRRLASYTEGTCGSVMTSSYAILRPQLSVSQAIDKLRLEAPGKETIYYAYVVDEQRKILGVVTLQDLILAAPAKIISEIMNEEFVTVATDDDQDEAAQKMAKYDLIVLPVIDQKSSLVGIITYDDIFDIIQAGQTEDMERFMAITRGADSTTYLRTPTFSHYKNRVVWLIALSILGIFSGMIIHSYQDGLMSLMVLALYMPMIADTGGNSGSQSATVIIRALALGEFRPNKFFPVLYKEFKVSFLLAITLGILAYGKVLFLSSELALPNDYSLFQIAAVISAALGLQVMTSTVIGAALPLCAAGLRLDPALVASPALTTVVDITGLLIYFGMAVKILGFS